METKKRARLDSLLAQLAAEFINRESSRASLITVTRAEVAEDGKEARIFVSVLPNDKIHTALEFLTRERHVFENYVKSHARIGFVPRIVFLQEPNLT